MTSLSQLHSGYNWLGAWTLYRKEVWRFLKVWNQTLLAPMITTLLFLAILNVALGGDSRNVGALPFDEFVTPGLVMMVIIQNAFANTSSSLILSKFQGVIVDILMPPLSGTELTVAYAMGGITRGVCVGITTTLALYFFVDIAFVHPLYAILYTVLASCLLALFGILAGIYCSSFDQMAAFTNYIITPLSFLSGTFYTINNLPDAMKTISLYNPFFYMIDGFRYALTGHHDGNLMAGLICLLVLNVLLWVLVHILMSRGWRLKS